MIRVLIVEDQAILRESLARSVGDQPDMTVVAAIADASEALGVALKERPDMILMDVCTEHDSNGVVAAARIKEQLPECRIIIMTGMPEITFVDQAREAGVDSFVYKNVGIDELFAVMRSTLAGYCTFPKPPESIFSGTAALDDVELSILRLACEGKSRREIAAELFMSEGTKILAKAGCRAVSSSLLPVAAVCILSSAKPIFLESAFCAAIFVAYGTIVQPFSARSVTPDTCTALLELLTIPAPVAV